jgi:hypothetical protein
MDFKIGDLVEFDRVFSPSSIGIVIDKRLERDYYMDGYTWWSVVVLTASGEEILFAESEVQLVEVDDV